MLASIPRSDLGPFIEKEENDDTKLSSSPTKILGIGYVPEEDVFNFEGYTKLLEKEPIMTKRGISSVIPSLYDVNGLIAPYILAGKIILSNTWAYQKPLHEKKIDKNETAQCLLVFQKDDPSVSPRYIKEQEPDTGVDVGTREDIVTKVDAGPVTTVDFHNACPINDDENVVKVDTGPRKDDQKQALLSIPCPGTETEATEVTGTTHDTTSAKLKNSVDSSLYSNDTRKTEVTEV